MDGLATRWATTPRVGTLAATGVAVVLVLAACTTSVAGDGARGAGASRPDVPSTSPRPTRSASADDLVRAMSAAMRSVPSGYTVQGTYTESSGTAVLDLRMQGADGTGTLVLDGRTARVVSVGGKGWADAPASFWTDEADVDAATADRIADKWVALTGSIAFVQSFVDQTHFVDVLLTGQDDFEVTGSDTVDGVAVTTVQATDETLSIAAAGAPLLHQVEDDSGRIRFTFPDDDLQVSPPPADQTVPFPG